MTSLSPVEQPRKFLTDKDECGTVCCSGTPRPARRPHSLSSRRTLSISMSSEDFEANLRAMRRFSMAEDLDGDPPPYEPGTTHISEEDPVTNAG